MRSGARKYFALKIHLKCLKNHCIRNKLPNQAAIICNKIYGNALLKQNILNDETIDTRLKSIDKCTVYGHFLVVKVLIVDHFHS